MKKIKLSHSSVSVFNECPKKYELSYIDRIRPIKAKSALLFGKALDDGLNSLLSGHGLLNAKEAFLKSWRYQEINGEKIVLRLSNLVVYSKNDLDEELLNHYNDPIDSWQSLYRKGILMLESYEKNFLPLVKEVRAVQKPITLKNAEGDEITGTMDLIVEFHDGTVYLLDNKSSTVKYKEDSPRESQQLVLYQYIEKDHMKLNGVGFVVLDKNINKNRKKVCAECGFDGSATKHKTCNSMIPDLKSNDTNAIKRCGGKYIETIHPSANLTVILNEVTPEDETRVIEAFDKANEGISKGEFKENYDACKGKFGLCDYHDFCHKGSGEGLIQIEKK